MSVLCNVLINCEHGCFMIDQQIARQNVTEIINHFLTSRISANLDKEI